MNATDLAPLGDPRSAFIEACVWHGTLERAEAILAAHPEVASSNLQTAAILGDDAAVRRFLELDPGNATAKGGPRGWPRHRARHPRATHERPRRLLRHGRSPDGILRPERRPTVALIVSDELPR